MPRTKSILRRWGTVCEVESIFTTHWVQAVGMDIVRCDTIGKEGGHGAWTVTGPNRSATWLGGSTLVPGLIPENWIREDHVETFVSEVDYS